MMMITGIGAFTPRTLPANNAAAATRIDKSRLLDPGSPGRVFHEAWDPATQSYSAEALDIVAQKKSDEVASLLRRRLETAAIPLDHPLELRLDTEGSVVAGASDSRAAAVRSLFQQEPGLAALYKEAAAYSAFSERSKLGPDYERDWASASSDQSRAAVQSRYAEAFASTAGSDGRAMLTATGFLFASISFLPRSA